jgi:dipeptidyl-peptidase-4
MTKRTAPQIALASSLLLLSTYSISVAAGFDRDRPNSADRVADVLSVERVSIEPDSDERASSIRWSSDGARVAWMEMQAPQPSARIQDKTPQREIWSVAPRPENQTASQPAGSRILLVSAAKVTASLCGSDAHAHPKPEEDDQDTNPCLLRDFAWSPDHTSLLLACAQSIAWLDLITGDSHILVNGKEALTDAYLSPNGQTLSFLRNHELWLVPVHGGAAHQFTPKAEQDISEGEPDWPYRNELHLSHAYWWSPDSTNVAWLETDDRAVAKYALRASSGETRQIVYPKPGGELPIVHLFVKAVSGGRPKEIDLGSTKDLYIPRVTWLPDGRHLAIQRMNRLQQSLDLILADTVTGKTVTLFTEKDKYWINLSDILYFFKDGKRFLWSSERGGSRHLYLYDIQGNLITQLTRGNWEVTQLNAVDESNARIYFTATEKSPLERHLYRIDLDGKEMARVTQRPGTHQVECALNCRNFVDSFSSHATPPQLLLTGLDGTKQVELNAPIKSLTAQDFKSADHAISHHDSPPAPAGSAGSVPAPAASNAQPDAVHLPGLQPVEFIPLRLHLGAETHAFLIRPPAFDPTRKYPVIVYLAGGPGEQLVRDAWGGATGLWMQLMAQKGYIVFTLDNQGTAGRGHYFEEPIHLRLSGQELADQRDGLVYLSSLPYVDMARLGVCGWGYGGFLAVHAMLDRPVPFKAGFAGAPVLDWLYYDAVFAERYLDNPVTHADGWAASTALENDSPKFFKGALMVAQGTDDEFVHMENLLTLQDQLLDAGKSADILLLPDRGHAIAAQPSRLVLFQRMTDFFLRNL